MTLGPFLGRELTTFRKTTKLYGARGGILFMDVMIVAGCFVYWDWMGWDRSTIVGSRQFGLMMLGIMLFGWANHSFTEVASSIALERDRKTLDVLLTSPLSSFDIVLGVMAVGLIRRVMDMALMLPMVVLIGSLIGVPAVWALLAVAGIASTNLLAAGFAAVVSVGSRAVARACGVTMAIFYAWTIVPSFLLIIRIAAWPTAPGWLTSVVVGMAESSPAGLWLDQVGLIPQAGGPIEAVGRMVAWQAVGIVATVGWATLRLRPVSRSFHDVRGIKGRLDRLVVPLRSIRRRVPCTDDPVFWVETHSKVNPKEGPIAWLARKVFGFGAIAAIVVLIGWFAWPAFVELGSRGYGPMPEAFALPELHPIMRLLRNAIVPSLAGPASPGQARLELNMILRALTALAAFVFANLTFVSGMGSIGVEKRRDTWLGLITTPLTAREILRGKALGTLWNLRPLACGLVGLWTIGLVAGAVHPLGYLASIALLTASGSYCVCFGLGLSLATSMIEVRGRALYSTLHTLGVLGGLLLAFAGPPILAWAMLLTCEDVASAIRSGPFPQLGGMPVVRHLGARGVSIVGLLGTALMAYLAFRWWRSNERAFDQSIGRPTRPDPPVPSRDATGRHRAGPGRLILRRSGLAWDRLALSNARGVGQLS